MITDPNYLKGIDVSHHQPPEKMDYEALYEEGYRWLIARAAYGDRPDDTFVTHCEKAKAAGLLVGGYAFYRQTKPYLAQAKTFTTQLAKLSEIDILPVIDLEWNDLYDGKVKPDNFNDDGRRMVEYLSNTFQRSAICYLAPGFYQTLGNPKWLLDYPWWIAHYTQDDQPWCPFKDWDMWQFTGTGNTTGYPGALDINRARSVPLLDGRIANFHFPTGKEDAPPTSPSDTATRKAELFKKVADCFEELAKLEHS